MTLSRIALGIACGLLACGGESDSPSAPGATAPGAPPAQAAATPPPPGSSDLPPADRLPGEPDRVQLDTTDSAAVERWAGIQLRLTVCEPLVVQILYSFGSARISSQPLKEGADCTLTVETAGELAEDDKPQHRYRCTADVVALPWLKAEGGAAVRESPPDDELREACESVTAEPR